MSACRLSREISAIAYRCRIDVTVAERVPISRLRDDHRGPCRRRHLRRGRIRLLKITQYRCFGTGTSGICRRHFAAKPSSSGDRGRRR